MDGTTQAQFDTLIKNYPGQQQTVEDADSQLSAAKSALRARARQVDRNNKRWYGAWSNNFSAGSPEREALGQITTESGTAAPVALEIAALTPAAGNHVAVTYGEGGDHATTLELQYRLVGTETEFGHSTPVVPGGQTLGPFAAGATVAVRTRVANSAGQALGAVQTIVLP